MRIVAVLLGIVCTSVSLAAAAGDYTSQTLRVGVRKNMEATLYTPEGAGPFPMVLELHTSGSISSYDQGYCGKLALQGYICIAPAFLRAYGIGEENRRASFTRDAHAIVADFLEIIGELNALPKAKQGAVGAVGFSNGGFFVALLAATSHIKAGVSYYGAFDGARTQEDLHLYKERWHASSSPILILAGESDATIGTGPPKLLEQIIKAAGAPYEIKWYPGTGHDFDRSSTTGSGNAAAAADAWQRTLAFLRANGV